MRYVAATLFVAIAALPFVAMLKTGRPPEAPAPRAAETLAIMSPHRREVRLEYSRGFADWMRRRHGRHVEIKWLDVGGTSKILKELESRFATSPNDPGVDLLFGGGVAPYLTAIQQNWLARLDLTPGTLDDVPATCAGAPVYDPEHRWYGVALSGFGILYNRPLVQRLKLPAPGDWAALATPEYFTWVGSGDPRSSGSVHMCYEIILQAYGFEQGWALIARLCANVRTFGEAGGTVPREVAAGDIAAGMVIDQYAQTVIQAVGDDALALILPGAHTVIGPDAIAMLRGARQPELSRLFVEYALSREGQRLLYQSAGTGGQRSTLYRMPVVKSCYADPDAPRPNPYDFPAGLAYDNEKGMRRWNVLNDLLGVWLIDAHGDLRGAWRAVIARGCLPDDVAALCAPPLAEAELDKLAQTWKDPRRKHDGMQSWALAARERYRRLKTGSLPPPGSGVR
jgi:ABC-type Fe3+ transport system substrate-binding protein